MTDPTRGPATQTRLLEGSILAFTPVAQQRCRADGWTPLTQERFIRALEAMGSVGAAAKAVGMSRRSAYKLRGRDDADDFARVWDQALDLGRGRMFDYAMERALNGVTTVRIFRGGAVDVSCGPNMGLVNAAIREPSAPAKGTKVTI